MNDNEVVLRTKRLELKPCAPDFVDEIWEAVQSSLDELRQWMTFAVEASRESTLQYLRHSADQWDSGRDRNFAIFVNGSACGNCSLMRGDPSQMSAEIGYWLRSDLCGRGLMTEAASEVIDFGFSEEGLHRIELHAGVDNHASNRIAEKLGFTRVGTLRESSRAVDGFYDSYVYDLLVTDDRPDRKSHR